VVSFGGKVDGLVPANVAKRLVGRMRKP